MFLNDNGYCNDWSLSHSIRNCYLNFLTSIIIIFQLLVEAELFIKDSMQWTPCWSHLYWLHSFFLYEWLLYSRMQWFLWDHDCCYVCFCFLWGALSLPLMVGKVLSQWTLYLAVHCLCVFLCICSVLTKVHLMPVLNRCAMFRQNTFSPAEAGESHYINVIIIIIILFPLDYLLY